MEWSGEMHLPILFLLTAAAVCTAARPSGPEVTTPLPTLPVPKFEMQPVIRANAQSYMRNHGMYRRMFMPQFMGYDEETRTPVIASDEWLNKEIDRINQMNNEDDGPTSYEVDVTGWVARDPILRRMFDDTRVLKMRVYEPPIPRLGADYTQLQLHPPQTLLIPHMDNQVTKPHSEPTRTVQELNTESNAASKRKREEFALTPQDKGYFDSKKMSKQPPISKESNGMHEGGDQTAILFAPPRQIRQNPNLSKTKTLVADNLDRLRTGLQHEEGPSTDKPGHVHVLETPKNTAESIFGVALISAICVAVAMAMFGFAIGWYALFKKAKAAADVDYPAYGVTGPNIDSSGDRKLAHSAHMYHYQHQKQQIIAMERNGLEQRNGSISDPESEEENEEGDYTVYECPGFATTGDMEVKNPLFSEDPTPATPGKCELVKPQPKD